MASTEQATRLSDGRPPNTVAPAQAEHGLNLLAMVGGGIEKNAVEPAINSFAIEPANVGVNVVNGVSDGAAWVLNKVTGSNHTAPQLSKLTEFDLPAAPQGSVAFYSQQICGTAGSFLAYAAAGKIAGRALRPVGELAPLGLDVYGVKVGSGVRTIAQDTRVASVLGASTYAALKDPKEGESRTSNFVGTMIGFATFEAGGRFANAGETAASRVVRRYWVGSMGGALQTQAASLVHDHQLANPDAVARGALSSGLLNALMPTGKRIVDNLAEGPVVKGLPKVTEATARLHTDALRAQAPGIATIRGSWADPKAVKAVNQAGLSDLRTSVQVGDSGATRIDQQANVVHVGKDASPLSVIQELAHRKVFKDPIFENTFQSLAREISSPNPADPVNVSVKEKYVQTRVQQEIAARTEQNAAAERLGLPARVSVDGSTIRDQENYGAIFEREANDFVRSGGKSRPRVDYESSPSGTKVRGSGKDKIAGPHDRTRETDKSDGRKSLPSYNLETFSLDDLTNVEGHKPLSLQQWKKALTSGQFSVMLSGGGQQGYHHLGFLAALDEAKLHPHQVTGVSAGSTFHALDMAKDSSIKIEPNNPADREIIKSLIGVLKPDNVDGRDNTAGDRRELRTRLQALSASRDPAAQLEKDPSLYSFLSSAKRTLVSKHALDETFDTQPQGKSIDLTDLAWQSMRPYNSMMTGKDLGDGAMHGLSRIDLTQMWWDNPFNVWRYALGAKVPDGIPHITTWDGTQLNMQPAFTALDKRLNLQSHVTPASSFLAYDVENKRVVNFQGNYDIATALTASTAVNVDGNGVTPVEAIINGKHSTLVDLGVVSEGRFNSPTGQLPDDLPALVSQLPRPASPRRANDLVVDFATGERPPFPLVNDNDVLKMFANGYVETWRRLAPILSN